MPVIFDSSQELFECAVGAAGGAMAEIIHWHRVARRGRWPHYARSARYWILTAAMVLAGGVVTAAVSSGGSSPLQLLLVGIAAPQLVESLARSRTSRATKDVYLGKEERNWRDFLAT